MAEPLSLYSTITRIAYTIGQRFYGEKHYVWCTPAKGVDTIVGVNPPSADPVHIYFSLLRDVKSNEGHTSKIAENRRGLIHGANVKEGEGLIDTRTRELIEKIINRATITDFRPLFLVNPSYG